MLKLRLCCALLLLGSLLFRPASGQESAPSAKNGSGQASAALQHAILVSVNGKKITRHDLDDIAQILFTVNFPGRPMDEVTEEELDQLSTTGLRELIVLNLIEDELERINTDKDDKNNILIKDDETMDNVRDLGIEKYLAIPLTMRFAKSQLVMNQFLARTGTIFTPTPKLINNFYSAHREDIFTTERLVRVRHIFIPADQGESALSKKQAQMLYDELRKMNEEKRQKMFPEMAKEFSQGFFKEDGGLISIGKDGWFPQYHDFKKKDGGTFFPEGMLRGLRSLSGVGDVQLSKSEAGWHILFLENAQGGNVIPMPKVRKTIEDYLVQESIDKAKLAWLDRKSQASNILWHDGDPFPRDKILITMDPKQRLQFLRIRIHRLFDNSGEGASAARKSEKNLFEVKPAGKP